MVNNTMDLMDWLRKQVEEADSDFLREAVNYLAGLLMPPLILLTSGGLLVGVRGG